jgi:hypothetical protein
VARRRQQANAAALALALAPEPVAPAAPTVAAAATGGAAPPLPRPISAARYRFPCDACGVRGHWKSENKCNPEDVKNFALYLANTPLPATAAAPASTLPALPAPPGTTGMSYLFQGLCLLFYFHGIGVGITVCGFQSRAAASLACRFQS